MVTKANSYEMPGLGNITDNSLDNIPSSNVKGYINSTALVTGICHLPLGPSVLTTALLPSR